MRTNVRRKGRDFVASAGRTSGETWLEWVSGVPHFRGKRIPERSVRVGDRSYRVAAVKDAADLLDDPFYARRFVEHDVAPYGAELWPASIMLAAAIQDEAPGEGRRAIELGAGLGLVSIAASLHGWRMTLTDHDETSLRFARYNAFLNAAPIWALTVLDWHRPSIVARFDRVYAADVLYQISDHDSLLRCVRSLLSQDGFALIADPGRGVADHFGQRARDAGFDVTRHAAEARNQLGEIVKGRIFQLRVCSRRAGTL